MDLEALKEEVRARADIIDVIGRHVRLQKAGSSHKGLCPFHNEKTPSFHVDPKKQTYHCFGCGAGGDVFRFVMEQEHLDFMGALERLATQVGVPFELDGSRGQTGPKKDRLFALHEQATVFFEACLRSPNGAHALAYTHSRGIPASSLRDFRIGYAPKSFDTLLAQAHEWGFSSEEIEASGLFGIREDETSGKFYDRFRDRLMFPISDEQGRVIGFSGRILQPGDSKAKYVNSPETLLFKKSRVLYGIHRARQPIATARHAVLCEGQLDVIRCHEAGILHAIAAQGTAITEEHARILKRYADEVTLMLDADTAGVKAALRSAEALLGSGLIVSVASLPPGEDPDSLVRNQGAGALRSILEASEPFILFQVRTLIHQEGVVTETSRLRVAREVMKTISQAPEAVHREQMLRQASTSLGLSEQALRTDLSQTLTASPRPPPTPPPPTLRPSPSSPPRPLAPPPDTAPAAERLLLEVLLAWPEGIPFCKKHLRPDHLRHPDAATALQALYEAPIPTTTAILDHLREHPAASTLFALIARSQLKLDTEASQPESALRDLILLLRRAAILARIDSLEARCRLLPAEQRGDHESTLWQLTLHARRLEEFRRSSEWDKAAFLLSVLDSQAPLTSDPPQKAIDPAHPRR